MKYVKIPEPVTLRSASGEANKEPTEFTEWFTQVILCDNKWGKTFTDICIASDIKVKLDRANGVMELSDAEHEAVKAVVETPTAPYPTWATMQLVSFGKAILEASGEKPTE